MGPNAESSNNRLVHLRNIHADLLRKMAALESLESMFNARKKNVT